MTALKDPYPPELLEIDEAPVSAIPVTVNPDAVTNRLIAVLNRLAQAVEQNTLAILDNGSKPVQNAPGAALTALPPVVAAQSPQADVCPIHGTPWKTVPAGVSKRTGKAYDAFRACSTQGCDQRPKP